MIYLEGAILLIVGASALVVIGSLLFGDDIEACIKSMKRKSD